MTVHKSMCIYLYIHVYTCLYWLLRLSVAGFLGIWVLACDGLRCQLE